MGNSTQQGTRTTTVNILRCFGNRNAACDWLPQSGGIAGYKDAQRRELQILLRAGTRHETGCPGVVVVQECDEEGVDASGGAFCA